MEEPIIILSDDEDESHSNSPSPSSEKRRRTRSGGERQVVFPVKSKKKTSKNPTKQERQVFTWFLCHKFESHEEAADFILAEKVWSRWYNSSTESGAKQYYRCNRVKYSAKQCSARIYTRFSPNTPEVYLFSNNLDHDHQRSEDPSPHHRTARTAAHVKAGLPHQKEAVPSAKVVREPPPPPSLPEPEEESDDDGDEFDEDCGDEDDEDSFFIDTSLLRVEIDEEPDTVIEAAGDESQLQTFPVKEEETDDEEDDIVFVDEQPEPEKPTEDPPSMKISKIESHFNINQFILDIPKQKFTRMNWHQAYTFASGDEARRYIVEEKIWSKWYFSHTETGAKQYYRCNKAKYSGRQCAARIYLLYESNSDEVHLMVNGNDHDHDSSEFKATYTSLTDSLKKLIQKCCELKQKPKDIITKLEALNLPLPSRYHLRKYIVELQENM